MEGRCGLFGGLVLGGFLPLGACVSCVAWRVVPLGIPEPLWGGSGIFGVCLGPLPLAPPPYSLECPAVFFDCCVFVTLL
jgi:hypothetical protein